ncbi:MAG TPA: 4-alpha-glucanotransferase [Sedimentisphaerales bacterium]|nr:4-alpha-glucanotransferase [Sedimentisphaerales bacterium]
MTKSRASGLLLHITSLPSKYGIGDFGPEAYKFADCICRARQRYWQVLPLNPPTLIKNPYSPYNCLSAFAGNTLLISPELLYRQALLNRKDIRDRPSFPEGHVNYRLVISYKTKLLTAAFERFKGLPDEPDYAAFCSENKDWLEDYATFIALRRHFRRRLWCRWPPEFRDRKKQALKSVRRQLGRTIDREKFLQYVFFLQWHALKKYCNRHGIQIIGDIPIYVAYDSTDVWAHPEIFKLTKAKKPRVVAGVPPDLFSRSGQLWGNPVYDWHALANRDYWWWIQRIRQNLALLDIVRIDHFRGFIAFWQVPAGRKTAVNGKWVDGPKEDFLNTLFKHFPSLPFIVEDLGYITPDVRAVIEKFRLPSMRVLLFAFDGAPAANCHHPHNHVKNSVIYTGTHDNNTVRGWFENEAKPATRRRLFDCLGRTVHARQMHWEFIRLAMSSVGSVTIIPVQDVLGLGEQARMNRPATIRGNWTWRLRRGQITASIIRKLARLTETYGRV